MNKEWRKIDGYDKYYCSDDGHVKNVLTGKLLHRFTGTSGYLNVKLSKCGKVKTRSIHRLVALTFIGNSNPDLQVNHINGIKTDNALGNLEFVTQRENTRHAIEIGLFDNSGQKNGMSKLTDEDIPKIRELLASGEYTQKEIAEMFGVKKNAISEIKLCKKWSSVGSNAELDVRSAAEKKAVEVVKFLKEGTMSQAEISRFVGVSQATVSNIKKGKRRVKN